jgi:hypothetical protein
MSIWDSFPNDPYKPPVVKEQLARIDNYQIHNIYCEDVYYTNSNPPVLFRDFLAVERVSPYGQIECDFDQIAMDYP